MIHLKSITFQLLAICCITFFATSCSKNSSSLQPSTDPVITADNPLSLKNTTSTIATIPFNKALLEGTWTVSYYFDKSNKTTKFAGYTIAINANGTVVATKSNVATNGTWTTNVGLTKLYFAFTGVKLLEEISEDWKVISQTSSKLELVNISGGNGGTDYLTLVK